MTMRKNWHETAEDLPPHQSIDRYFSNVGERLIRARNRFEESTHKPPSWQISLTSI